jgi:hypothetical protein
MHSFRAETESAAAPFTESPTVHVVPRIASGSDHNVAGMASHQALHDLMEARLRALERKLGMGEAPLAAETPASVNRRQPSLESTAIAQKPLVPQTAPQNFVATDGCTLETPSSVLDGALRCCVTGVVHLVPRAKIGNRTECYVGRFDKYLVCRCASSIFTFPSLNLVERRTPCNFLALLHMNAPSPYRFLPQRAHASSPLLAASATRRRPKRSGAAPGNQTSRARYRSRYVLMTRRFFLFYVELGDRRLFVKGS